MTEFRLAGHYVPTIRAWLSFTSPFATLMALKLLRVLLTLALALYARWRLIPHLRAQTLPALAWYGVAVTLLSVLFVVVGVAFPVGSVP